MNWQSNPGGAAASVSGAPPEPAGEPSRRIADVCAETGLSPRTVRYYEELGLLPGVRRRAGGRRVYGPDELERLRFIQRLKALGLSLAEIRELNGVYAIGGSTRALLERLEELLALRRRELDERIRELTTLRGEIERYHARVKSRIRGSATRAGARRGAAR